MSLLGVLRTAPVPGRGDSRCFRWDLARAKPATPALKQLPALSSPVGPRGAQTSSGRGGAYLNLRNLGPTRTLTLFDGRGFIPNDGSGQVDTNLFPQVLVERVEVITGGASAA